MVENNYYKIINFINIIITIIIFNNCASIAPPTGGEKDKTKPKLVRSVPINNSTNYIGKKVILEFDEIIIGEKPKQLIKINPFISSNEYDIEIYGKKVEINFKNPLKNNTTYHINFDQTIRDIREKNIRDSLELSFSTGQYLDTGYIYGYVEDYLTKNRVDKSIICLYKSTDTINLENTIPLYITSSDKNGIFKFKNLKSLEYQIYTFEDKNEDKKYNSRTDKSGFLKNNLIIENNKDSIRLSLINFDINKPKIYTTTVDRNVKITLNEKIKEYKILNPSVKIDHHLLKERNVISILNTKSIKDSLIINLYLKDSSNNDTTIKKNILIKKDNTINKPSNIIEYIDSDYINDSLKITVSLNYLLYRELDSSMIVNIDSIYFRKITLIKNFNKIGCCEYQYKDKIIFKEYLKLYSKAKTLFSDQGDSNLLFEKTFLKEKYDEEASNLKVIIDTKETHYYIELLDKEYKLIKKYFNVKKFEYKDIKPGTYYLRAIIDTNKDNNWFKGDIRTKTESEKIILYKGELLIKENWDVDQQTFRF